MHYTSMTENKMFYAPHLRQCVDTPPESYPHSAGTWPLSTYSKMQKTQ